MASSTGTVCFYLTLILLQNYVVPCLTLVPYFEPSDILDATTSFCVILFPERTLTDRIMKLLSTLVDVSFKNETGVLFGKLQELPIYWPNGHPLKISKNVRREELENSVLIFKKRQQDRTCLLMTDKNYIPPPVVNFKLPTTDDDVEDEDTTTLLGYVVEYINEHCATFRHKSGSLNIAGIHRKEILDNLFSTSWDRHSLQECLDSTSPDKCNCAPDNVTESYDTVTLQTHEKDIRSKTFKECERIEMPRASDFFHEYLSRSKPVIITGATQHWTAFQKWTNKFLRESYGGQKVHIKITPDGQYEGVEPISLWENHDNFYIPKPVYEQLKYPDLVVVRPASIEILFSEFLDLIENISLGRVQNLSAYLEYSSIIDYFPDLREDVDEMHFFTNILKLKHLNIWLSDGNTLGKLHFDPFDNFLCQISGEKQLLLFEPYDNTRLYEGHIQEAMLTFNASEKRFYRKILLDSTSMVMSPVDLLKPDLQRFPKFANVHPISCTIGPGDVLYMPSFWWHEVQSKPDISEHRNLAVNFWYEPFLTREFPCPECKLDVNFKYSHLL